MNEYRHRSTLTRPSTLVTPSPKHFTGSIQSFWNPLQPLIHSPCSSLFGWLVNRVNSIVFKGERASSINILDIFGFEDFPVSLPPLLSPLSLSHQTCV